MTRGVRTLYQDTGQMAAADEDLSNNIRDWVDKRGGWLSDFEETNLLEVARLVLNVGFRVAKETRHDEMR